jgi:hypothetical protein
LCINDEVTPNDEEYDDELDEEANAAADGILELEADLEEFDESDQELLDDDILGTGQMGTKKKLPTSAAWLISQFL